MGATRGRREVRSALSRRVSRIMAVCCGEGVLDWGRWGRARGGDYGESKDGEGWWYEPDKVIARETLALAGYLGSA